MLIQAEWGGGVGGGRNPALIRSHLSSEDRCFGPWSPVQVESPSHSSSLNKAQAALITLTKGFPLCPTAAFPLLSHSERFFFFTDTVCQLETLALAPLKAAFTVCLLPENTCSSADGPPWISGSWTNHLHLWAAEQEVEPLTKL